ncbi:MAG: hypothetical protein AUJ52_11795 [Elusimicrobia bacterium CG1_02_63_36]|nr:MAG: hypothetical protein AUJ52_11795 [Elusimicrobia bacterium CG1_02_63_36]
MRDELSELMFRSAFIDTDEAVAGLDAQRRVAFWSRGCRSLLGTPACEAEGKPLQSFFHDPTDCENVFEATRQRGAVRNFEVRLVHADGGVNPASLSVNRFGEDPPRGFIVRFAPVQSDFEKAPGERSLREALVRMERFSSVGRITAAFAHEMRTPLHVISSTAELALEDSAEGSRERDDLSMILRNAHQASSSVLALLEFAKSGKSRLREDSLTAVVQSVLCWIEKLCQKQGILLISNLPKLPPLLMDANSLRSVLHNILVNAVEAMPEGGTLTVVTKALEDGGALLTVCDTGPGMPESVLAKAGTAFFTTKEDGTGLGLYLANRVLAEHGAVLDFSCPDEGGTLVSVLFPGPNSAIHP